MSFDEEPELIDPILVTILGINKTDTVYSDGLDGMSEEFNNIVREDPVEILAQIAFDNTRQKPEYQLMGTDEQAKGYLVLRYIDIKNAGITLERGDKITKLGEGDKAQDVEYYLLHSSGDPAAHSSELGGFTLVRMFFGDKEPVK